MKSIFLATDFSERSDRAFDRALALASARNATLHLGHVVDSDLPKAVGDAQEKAASAQLERFAEAAKAAGIECVLCVTSGEPHDAIAQAAEEASADIIAIGVHRRDPLRNAFVGTTAERLIRTTSTPVLVVRRSEPKDYQSCAVAVNIAEEGMAHVEKLTALELCDRQNLTLIHAYDDGQFNLMRRAGTSRADLKAIFEEEKNEITPLINDMMRKLGLDPSQAIIAANYYNTPDTILKAATQVKADLLVVGVRRRTAFKRYTLGSVSEGCLLQSEIDLLILPPVI
ncbi:MAG: universal stress protein [Pseudomonadota bacterium]